MESSPLERVSFTLFFHDMLGNGLYPERSIRGESKESRLAKEVRAQERRYCVTWTRGKKETNSGATPYSGPTDDGVGWGHSAMVDTLLSRIPKSNPAVYQSCVARTEVDEEGVRFGKVRRFQPLVMSVEVEDGSSDGEGPTTRVFGSTTVDLAMYVGLPKEYFFDFLDHSTILRGSTDHPPRSLKVRVTISSTKRGTLVGGEASTDAGSKISVPTKAPAEKDAMRAARMLKTKERATQDREARRVQSQKDKIEVQARRDKLALEGSLCSVCTVS